LLRRFELSAIINETGLTQPSLSHLLIQTLLMKDAGTRVAAPNLSIFNILIYCNFFQAPGARNAGDAGSDVDTRVDINLSHEY